MTEIALDDLSAAWTRAGAMFLCRPATASPDLERLVVDTTRGMGQHPRLFVMAGSWLVRYGDRVSPGRLERLVRDELEPAYQPGMGLMLESVDGLRGDGRFAGAIAACRPAADAGPLFDVERTSPVAWRIADRRASPLSRKWGRWAAPFEPKDNAIRPAAWVDAHNPAFAASPPP